MRRRDVLRGSAAALGLSAVSSLTTDRATAHPGPYRPYGFVDVSGAKEAVVGPDGQTAFVASTNGYAVVDISVADQPELVATREDLLVEREGGPLRQVWDVKLGDAGNRLFVAGPANGIPGALSGMLVEDVSDPANPETLAFFETDHPIHNCYVSGGYAYLTANEYDRNPFVVVNVRGDEPRQVGEWSLLDENSEWEVVSAGRRTVHDIWVQGGVAYLAHWDAGTWMVDVSTPSNPRTIGRLETVSPSELAADSGADARVESRVPPGNDHYVATNENATLLAVGKESWAVRSDDQLVGGPSGVELWDISNRTAPQRLSTIEPPPSPDPTYDGVWTTAHNLELGNGRLYTSWYRGGVKRHDISDPRNPEELAWWREPAEASFWTARLARPGQMLVASSRGTGDTPGRLYVFPDHAGQQTNPPSLGQADTSDVDVLTPTPGPNSGDDASGGGGANGRDGSSGGNDAGTPASASDSGDIDDSSAIVAPGFGIATGVTALGAGAWLAKRRKDNERQSRDNTTTEQ